MAGEQAEPGPDFFPPHTFDTIRWVVGHAGPVSVHVEPGESVARPGGDRQRQPRYPQRSLDREAQHSSASFVTEEVLHAR